MDSNERAFINTRIVNSVVSLYKASNLVVSEPINCDTAKQFVDDLIKEINKISVINEEAKNYAKAVTSQLLIIKLKIDTLNKTTAMHISIATTVAVITAKAKMIDYKSISLAEWLDSEVVPLFPTMLVIKYNKEDKKEKRSVI